MDFDIIKWQHVTILNWLWKKNGVYEMIRGLLCRKHMLGYRPVYLYNT